MKSDEFYDHLSSDYASFNGVSRHYLAAVDYLAARRIDGAKSWLDIGTGDGLRAAALLDALRDRPRDVRLCDSSAGMVEAAKRNLPWERVVQWGMTSETPFPPGQTFEVITLLGNVLGHVHPEESRVKQLSAVRPLLADNGTLLLDFNNRWNTRTYGMRRAAANILRELMRRPHPTFTASKSVNGKPISTPVYLGSPREYRLLLSRAGFHIDRIAYHHYSTGALASPFTGQGLIQATKKEKP